jgi:hypothetical protein
MLGIKDNLEEVSLELHELLTPKLGSKLPGQRHNQPKSY